MVTVETAVVTNYNFSYEAKNNAKSSKSFQNSLTIMTIIMFCFSSILCIFSLFLILCVFVVFVWLWVDNNVAHESNFMKNLIFQCSICIPWELFLYLANTIEMKCKLSLLCGIIWLEFIDFEDVQSTLGVKQSRKKANIN